MLSLLGCYYISDDELAAAIQEHNVAAGPVSVASVEPAWGLTTGGEELVIRGKGFSEDVEVSFGGAVAEVTRASTDTLYVTAPAHEGEGEVDVAVSRGDIVGHLDGGYTYWADGEGLIGLVGSIWYFQKRGGYWSASEQDEANVQFRAISPVEEFDYSKSWAASLDTCEANPVSPYTVAPYDLGALTDNAGAVLTSGAETIHAAWDKSYSGWSNLDVPVDQFYTTQTWVLQPIEVPNGPTFETNRALVSPASWEVTSPRIDGASMATASLDGLKLSWTNPGGTTVLLQLGLIASGGTGFESEVFCALNDDGSFTLPPSATAGWPANREVHILVGRYVHPAGTIPFSGATADGLFVDWRYGAFRSE